MKTTFYIVLEALIWLIQIFSWVMIASALMSWFVRPGTKLMRVYWTLRRITDPIVAPFRKLTSRLFRTGLPIDLAPMFAYLALQLVSGLLSRIQYYVLVL